MYCIVLYFIDNLSAINDIQQKCNSQACIKNILDFSDFICIQEHWLFKLNKKILVTCLAKTSWTCKSVDENNPIPPTQRPRGYGGVAILWKQSMDHLVEQIEDGSERIICIKLKVKPKPILLICAYMPCNGSKQANTHFKECLDQLHEIITKYSDTCTPVLCGDWNCDLMKSSKKPARSIWMEEFINSKKLAFKPTPLTFIHPNGNESSTIDYIFVHSNLADKVNNTIRLDMLPNNTSDHYPLLTEIEIEMDSGKEKDKNFTSNKIKWDNIDLLQYQEWITHESSKACFQWGPFM
ncbi:E3.1.11.2 [Mytilus edulis]|uniref:E3.1.11.2 n=1 Tax=Mytilus edulis TaxID=6550 RepID=A0A8S3S3C4_MYTED|nr:E3.1.11.2 [Mytilus edulis]